jgi:hypothetical protein
MLGRPIRRLLSARSCGAWFYGQQASRLGQLAHPLNSRIDTKPLRLKRCSSMGVLRADAKMRRSEEGEKPMSAPGPQFSWSKSQRRPLLVPKRITVHGLTARRLDAKAHNRRRALRPSCLESKANQALTSLGGTARIIQKKFLLRLRELFTAPASRGLADD